ncbi:Uncharacterized membrane protein YeiB [Amycolatopsis xylanica]|uniref:Uncharacterized membrane protein YeiB n=1 Tax=Amycolatopsis xylanica TaxID=589385 RepID=A0A1H3DM15_9PSEU|nr:DUF418 domain-containing protein [Amycolatopsis xylanica]SDX67552.1 Uncharacterized membrane protein YeiB [Amycolatopsis xylanica]
MTVHTATRGPVQRTERALAPDLARGGMLLFIAVANALGCVAGGMPGFVPTASGLDRGLDFFMFTFVHSRAYPVFAVMFGYGLVQLARRQERSGAEPGQVRSVLLRRNAWLVGFGLVHGVLLYFGDFLGAYGLVGIVATLLLLRRSDRVYRFVPWIWGAELVYALVLFVITLTGVTTGTASVPVEQVGSLVAPDYATSVLDRLGEWPAHTATVLGFILIVWLGMWAARKRLLEDPAANRVLLRRVAVGGLSVAVVGGLPIALVSAGLLSVDESSASAMLMLHGVSGMFAGPGYVALFGLLALRLAKPGPFVGSIAALGQRSLSGYLLQSVVWLLALAPFTLALGTRFGSPTVTAILLAVVVWLVSVFAAGRLGSRPGPAEFVLRRLTYGRR